MNQLEQRQKIRRQEEMINSLQHINFQNAKEIENLEDKLDRTVKMTGRTIREISFSSDFCMFASGASGLSCIISALDGEIFQAGIYLAIAILLAIFSRLIRRTDWGKWEIQKIWNLD